MSDNNGVNCREKNMFKDVFLHNYLHAVIGKHFLEIEHFLERS
jgi:hypothetical protein